VAIVTDSKMNGEVAAKMDTDTNTDTHTIVDERVGAGVAPGVVRGVMTEAMATMTDDTTTTITGDTTMTMTVTAVNKNSLIKLIHTALRARLGPAKTRKLIYTSGNELLLKAYENDS